MKHLEKSLNKCQNINYDGEALNADVDKDDRSKDGGSLAETPWHQDESYWPDLPDKRALSFWSVTRVDACVCVGVSGENLFKSTADRVPGERSYFQYTCDIFFWLHKAFCCHASRTEVDCGMITGYYF